MTYPAPLGYYTPFSRTSYFFNMSRETCRIAGTNFVNSSLYDKIAAVILTPVFLIATIFIDLVCMGTNLVYRWKLTPTLRENTKALTEPIQQHLAQIVWEYLEASDLDKFLLDPQTLGVAELKGRIEQTGLITAQQFERLEFLNAHCGPNQKIGIELQKVTRVTATSSDITNEQLGALLNSFPHINQFSVNCGCKKLTQNGVQTIFENNSRQWKSLQLHSSFHYQASNRLLDNWYDLETGCKVNMQPQLLDVLSTQVSSLGELSLERWFPPQVPFDRLLQNCKQLKSFSARGNIDSDEPHPPSIAALASCLSLEKLSIGRFGNQQDALPRIFENCPLKHVSLFEPLLNIGSISLLAESRQNDLHTLELYMQGLTEKDICALGRHCHGLQNLSIPYDSRIPNRIFEEVIANNPQLEAFAFCWNCSHRDNPTIPNFEALAKARPNLKHFYSAAASPTVVQDMRTMIRLCPGLKSIWIRVDFSGARGEEETRLQKQQLKTEFPHISFNKFYLVDWKPFVPSHDYT